MKIKSLGKVALAASFFFLLTGCQPTLECGTWVFTGTPSGNAFPLTSAFTFNPASCGKKCDCQKDVMIQMTWVYDTDTQTNLYASDQPQGARSTSNGWSIDRVDGAAYGYYGLLNDGSTFYSGWNTPGANGTPNTLYDEPGGWGANTYFYAVDVAVCFTSETREKPENCHDRILGYYFWSYILDNNDVGQEFITAPAWKDLDAEFQSALAAWNNWAPTSGPETDSTATLPNAVAFPTLSDL
jgi:hypothetical protein